jgi:hypothetical protein
MLTKYYLFTYLIHTDNIIIFIYFTDDIQNQEKLLGYIYN